MLHPDLIARLPQAILDEAKAAGVEICALDVEPAPDWSDDILHAWARQAIAGFPEHEPNP